MIIPVMDIMNNDCVSGKSGHRSTYTHLKSIYGDTPIEIATNLKKEGAKALYIADLDKIENKGNNDELISSINEIIPVLLDNGISNIDDVENNKKISTCSILATETMTDIDTSIEIFKKVDSKHILISIDIKNNEILSKNNTINIEDIIQLINKIKPKYTILLNITQVGTKQQAKSNITKKIISETPHTNHIIAGGVTNDTIDKYKKQDINNFLIGTILHEGNLEYNL
ncbi:HisA/HisF-related TIM barrel protein [Methanosphaera sp.]